LTHYATRSTFDVYDSLVALPGNQGDSRGVDEQARKRLRWLDAATSLTDLSAIQDNRLEPLQGDRAGQHSVRINDRWRTCFSWRDGNAHDVEIVDYH
jgi:proteic killer suppression protein